MIILFTLLIAKFIHFFLQQTQNKLLQKTHKNSKKTQRSLYLKVPENPPLKNSKNIWTNLSRNWDGVSFFYFFFFLWRNQLKILYNIFFLIGKWKTHWRNLINGWKIKGKDGVVSVWPSLFYCKICLLMLFKKKFKKKFFL